MTLAQIMIVEDEVLIARDLKNKLARFGYQVPQVAASGEEAVEGVVRHRPDLVLMDIRLQGALDGIEAAEIIHQAHGIPIIYLTAFASDVAISRAVTTEPYGYLIKPFNERELKSAIEIALFKHQMEKTRKKAERELEKSHSLLRATLEATPDGILVVNHQGKTVSFNRKFTEMFRIPEPLTPSPKSDQAWLFILDQVKDPKNFAQKMKVTEISAVEEGYDLFALRDGRIFERFSEPQFLEGKCVGRVFTFRDVTHQKRAEEALKEKSEELMRSNAELNRFVSVVSHDVHEPLHLIGTFAARLKKHPGVAEDVKIARYVDKIESSVKRMNELTRHLLEYSKVSFDRVTLETVNLNKIVEEVLGDLEVAVEKSGAKLEVGDLPVIRADKLQMQQLFLNLISNGIKFARTGISPQIQVASRLLLPEHARVEIRVTDNGIGIPEDQKGEVFQPFFRVEKGRSAEGHEGCGIGLTICEKIMLCHGGTIRVDSAVGAGSTFILTFPVIREEEPVAAEFVSH
ncbi:MAG: response regulator [Deltaproteobacteria bacterium]|nr:response regulator [Deltaproteobacteria bacterium]